ncbi:MAG TPA: hypothetical protein VLZ72_01265 [Flavobacterium sp.]|nr:hypothetical protein [Flavobacterium sp.]
MKYKQYITTIFILFLGVVFGQDSLLIVNDSIRLENLKKITNTLNGGIPPKQNTSRVKTIEHYIPLRLYVSVLGDLYARDIYKNPLNPLYPEKGWNKKLKKPYKPFKPLLEYFGKDSYNKNDTLIISENEIKYIRNVFSTQNHRISFDSVALNINTKDTLNGLYKVKSENGNYDYFYRYFDKGTPFLPLENNMSLYYKNGKVVKKRFFVTTVDKYTNYSSNSYVDSYIEDYIPIAQNKWKREVKTYPSEKLLVEDTVIVSGRKAYVDGKQNIYRYYAYQWNQPPQKLLFKTHTFRKGKITELKQYWFNYSYIDTKTTDLTDKNLKTIKEKRDFSGNLHSRIVTINTRKKKDLYCGNELENYYVDEDKQCFVFHGEHYEYKGSEKRNHFLDTEEILIYDKGILLYFQLEEVNPTFIEISDNLTLKTFGKAVVVRRKQSVDYKNRISVKEYYSKPSNKLFLKVKTVYEGCLQHPLFTSYKCKEKFDNNNYITTVEYFDQNGTLIFAGNFDQDFKGEVEDYLNSIYK